jgi:hypothetical protein
MTLDLAGFQRWLEGQLTMGVDKHFVADYLRRFVKAKVSGLLTPTNIVVTQNEVAVTYHHSHTYRYETDTQLRRLTLRMKYPATPLELLEVIRSLNA